MSLISSFVDKVRRPATARQARRPAAELVRPAAELVRPAAELVRPAAELVRPAAELVEAGADRMAERTIAFEHIAAQVVGLVRAQLAATDPDNYHWMQDLYYDNGTLFAVTVSAGRLWRWPVALDRNDQVSVGEPVIVKVNFSVTNEAPAGRMSTLRETSDGRWLGASVLCTATVNKMGILDSRGLFDSFIARFKGDGSEYINLLHLGGGVSKIGVLRHIFRDDKFWWAFMNWTKTIRWPWPPRAPWPRMRLAIGVAVSSFGILVSRPYWKWRTGLACRSQLMGSSWGIRLRAVPTARRGQRAT